MTNNLLQLPVTDMLEELGKGKGMPGSGCVSAFTAISGTQLLLSVCKLTVEKEKYVAVHDEIMKIKEELEDEFIPKLMDICGNDISIVEKMFHVRHLRDVEEDKGKKEEYKLSAAANLRMATESVADLCGTCIDIIPRALFVYDKGLVTAKGDTAVVISNLIAAVSGALYMTVINLNVSKDTDWVHDMHSEIETYFGRLKEYHHTFNGRLNGLYNRTFL